MNELNVTVEKSGPFPGTMEWFDEIIENSDLIISKTRDNCPGIFLRKKKTEGGLLLSEIQSPNGDRRGWKGELPLLRLFVENRGDNYGFSDYTLTPGAKKKVTEFIDSAAEALWTWFETQ